MEKRLLDPSEICRILDALAGDEPYDLGGGLEAVRTARKDAPGFRIDKNGAWGKLVEDLPLDELGALSAVVWERGREYFSPPPPAEDKSSPDDRRDELLPDWMKEAPDPLEGTPAGLLPDELRDKPDDPTLEPDPTGLIPDELREKLDPLAGTIEGLAPYALRGKSE